jgi:hypothetical protein
LLILEENVPSDASLLAQGESEETLVVDRRNPFPHAKLSNYFSEIPQKTPFPAKGIDLTPERSGYEFLEATHLLDPSMARSGEWRCGNLVHGE